VCLKDSSRENKVTIAVAKQGEAGDWTSREDQEDDRKDSDVAHELESLDFDNGQRH
jgi:hypothetical protein